MLYAVKIAVVFVKVGSSLWVNTAQVAAIRPENSERCPTEIYVVGDYEYLCSDWPLERVKDAIEKGSK